MLTRPLEPHDQSEWLRLRRALWADCSEAMHSLEMEEYANSAGTRAVFVIVREDGRLGGFVEVSVRDRVDGSMSPRVAYVEGWFVDPDLRRQGFGRKLVDAAERWGMARGLTEIASDAELDNAESVKAHHALGFYETFRLAHFLKPLKTLAFLGTFIGLMTCAQAASVTEVKVMSFNIWVSGRGGLSNCIEVIRTSGADIVGLQECNATTAQTIANALGFHATPDGDVSIVSRFPIVASIPASGGRGVTIELGPGQRVHLFNCHLTAYPYGPYDLKNGRTQGFIINQENSTRMPALNQLLSAMSPYLATAEPCFLVGDFNAPSHFDYASFPWPTSIACTNAGLIDSYHLLHSSNRKYPGMFAFDEPGITWTPMTNQEPEGVFDRIDFVHFSAGDGVAVTNSTELDGRNSISPWPSDHRAVLSTFTLTPPPLIDKASGPSPANGATNVPLNVTVSWLPGSNTLSHEIYFGTNSPGTLRASQTNASFNPGPLAVSTTYYWRVDEVKAAGKVTGNVWSFTTGVFPALQSAKPAYLTNETISISFTNGPGAPKDWIGLYAAGAAHGPGAPSITWFYTDGTKSGTLSRTAGTIPFAGGLPTPGNYEARFFANDGYTLLASLPFAVENYSLKLNRIDPAGGGQQLSWTTRSGKSYGVRFATNLPAGNWTQMLLGETNSWIDLNIAGVPQKFYQAFEQ